MNLSVTGVAISILIKSLFIKLEKQLEAEYHLLSLWYFVFLLSGIIFYFAFLISVDFGTILILSTGSLTSIVLQKYGIFWRFVRGLIIAFAMGMLLASFRTKNLDTRVILAQVITEVEGDVQQVKPTINGYQITLQNVWLQKTRYGTPTKIRINVAERFSNEFLINNRIKLLAKLFPLSSSILPGGYDFGFYSYYSGIGATGYAMSKIKIKKQNGKEQSNLIYKIRKSIYESLIEGLGKTRGNFAAAILLGETKGIESGVMQDMRQSGISHILCVSGLHLSLVAIMFMSGTRFLLNISDYIAHKFNIKMVAAFCSLLGSYFYLELSGMQIAAKRAFIMTGIFIISIIVGRSAYPLRSISLAAVIILYFNPEFIFHPSFQLSFIAVLSLISGFEFSKKYQLLVSSGKTFFAKFKHYLAANIYSSFLASVLTAPVVVNQFYIFSTYSIPMNLIAVPIMSFFMMPLAIISVMLMPIGLEFIPFKLLGFFINIVIKSAHFANNSPGAVWYFGYITPLSILLFLFGFFWICIWQKTWRLWGLAIMGIAFILMFFAPKPDLIIDLKSGAIGIKNKKGKLEIHAERMSKFNQNYWANWYGQKEVDLIENDILAQNNLFTTKSGQKIAINYLKDNCYQADIQINTKEQIKCEGKVVLHAKDLTEVSNIMLFCDKSSCKFKFGRIGKFKS